MRNRVDMGSVYDQVFITVAQAAEMIAVSAPWLYAKIEQGKGPPIFRRGKLIRIRRDEFEQWSQQREVG